MSTVTMLTLPSSISLTVHMHTVISLNDLDLPLQTFMVSTSRQAIELRNGSRSGRIWSPMDCLGKSGPGQNSKIFLENPKLAV